MWCALAGSFSASRFCALQLPGMRSQSKASSRKCSGSGGTKDVSRPTESFGISREHLPTCRFHSKEQTQYENTISIKRSLGVPTRRGPLSELEWGLERQFG